MGWNMFFIIICQEKIYQFAEYLKEENQRLKRENGKLKVRIGAVEVINILKGNEGKNEINSINKIYFKFYIFLLFKQCININSYNLRCFSIFKIFTYRFIYTIKLNFKEENSKLSKIYIDINNKN